MVLIEMVDVLARDDVYLLVPVGIERRKLLQLVALHIGQMGKVFQYLVHFLSSLLTAE